MRPLPRLLLALGAFATPAALAGWGGPDVDDPDHRRSVQQAASDARAQVDSRAMQVGSRARPRREELLECERGGEEGRRAAYSVWVETGEALRAVAGNQLRDAYENRGWAASYRGSSTMLFQRAGTRLKLVVDVAAGTATVGSTGGCVV